MENSFDVPEFREEEKKGKWKKIAVGFTSLVLMGIGSIIYLGHEKDVGRVIGNVSSVYEDSLGVKQNEINKVGRDVSLLTEQVGTLEGEVETLSKDTLKLASDLRDTKEEKKELETRVASLQEQANQLGAYLDDKFNPELDYEINYSGGTDKLGNKVPDGVLVYAQSRSLGRSYPEYSVGKNYSDFQKIVFEFGGKLSDANLANLKDGWGDAMVVTGAYAQSIGLDVDDTSKNYVIMIDKASGNKRLAGELISLYSRERFVPKVDERIKTIRYKPKGQENVKMRRLNLGGIKK